MHGPRVAGTGVRRTALVLALVAGVLLAVLVEPSVTTWLEGSGGASSPTTGAVFAYALP